MTDTIRPLAEAEQDEWLRLRLALWPNATPGEHRAEMAGYFAGPRRAAVLVCPAAAGGLCGFVEVGIRDYAEGCDGDWIGYVEGWYVASEVRRRGVGRALIAAAEAWAMQQGCREMASDAELANSGSLAAHGRLGYEEVVRAVHFRKSLPSGLGGGLPRPGGVAIRYPHSPGCRAGQAPPLPREVR